MFTNNYINFKFNMFTGLYSGETLSTQYGEIDGKYFVGVDGASVRMGYESYGQSLDIGQAMRKPRCQAITVPSSVNIDAIRNNYCGIYFGSGSTPATKDDYTLANPITTGLTVSGGIEKVGDFSDGKAEITGRYVLLNTTESEINIWEIGCFTPMIVHGSSKYYKLLMMERTVLSEPITIAPGTASVVTYKLTFNQTLNVE